MRRIRIMELKMSQMIKIFLIVLVVVVFGIIFYLNTFSLRQIRQSEVEKERILLENMVNIWDSTIENNTIYIENYLANDQDVVELDIAKTHEDLVYALQDVKHSLDNYKMLNYGMDEIFFYSENAGENGYLASNRKDTSGTKLLRQMVREFIDLGEETDRIGMWHIERLDDTMYLVFIQKHNGNYMGCWCSVDNMLENLARQDVDESYRIFVTDQEGYINSAPDLQGKTINLESITYQDEESGIDYWQIVQRSNLIPVCFVEHIEKSTAEEGIISARNIMLFIGILLIISMAIWSGILEYILYRPFRTVLDNMTFISEGNLDTRIKEESYLKEIRLLNHTFNKMAEEIQNLKIEIYEKEIVEQKTRLDYMQIQIHPHFLVNGLNSVCAMIDMDRTVAAKEMCTYLAEYFRFQYQNNSGMIPILTELQHVETYINIEKMRHPGKLNYYCEIEDSCKVVLIPPILILTFVGNSFKYGMSMKDFKNTIMIRITREGDHTLIRIRDEGPGFSEEVLECIRTEQPIYQKNRECIGIHNAIIRMKLFFGEAASVRAYNDEGAVVEIVVP